MRKYLYLLLGALMCLTAHTVAVADPIPSGPTSNLSGKVTDKIDNSPLVGVVITIPELSEGTTTDADGNYSFSSLPRRILTLQVSYLGHQTILRKVDLTQTTKADFVMQESNAMLNEVVVTGLTGRAVQRDAPIPESVVTADQLRGTASTNIIDALSHQPGVAQITTGGGISKPVIRGLGFNRLVVVSDGIRQEGNQWGDEHGIEVDDQSISSAEIIKGPASLMYGSDAMAGVIILHDDPMMARNTQAASATTEYQSNTGLFGYSVNFRGNTNGWLYSGRWSDKMAHDYHNALDHYVIGTRFRQRAAEASTGYNGNWGYSHLKLSYFHLTPGIAEGERDDHSTDYGKTLPFQQVHHYKAVSDNAFYIGNATLSTLIGYQQNRRQEYEESAQTPGLDMQLHTLNYDLHLSLPEQNTWKMTIGVGGMWQRNLNKGDEYLIPGYQLFDIGTYATSSYKAGDWTLSGGLRLDHRHVHTFLLDDLFSSLSRNFTSLSGSVGAVWHPTSQLNIRMNAARGFRAPNIGELSANGVHEGTQQYLLGNGNLKAEHSWQFDIGADYTSAWLTAQLSLFANFIDNYIYSARLANQTKNNVPVYQYTQGSARLLGGEGLIDIHPIARLHWQNTFSYVNSVQLHQPHDSKYLPMTPAPRWEAQLRYTLIEDGQHLHHTYVAANMECNLRQNHYYALGGTETATPSYTLFGLTAGTALKLHGRNHATLSVTADNLFNRAYQSHLSRLKYIGGINEANGRSGLYNMGRNVTVKLALEL